MGFDITFHPITINELKEYFFDIVKNSGLAEGRAVGITTNPEKQSAIIDIFKHFTDFKKDVINGKSSFSNTFSFAAAAIAGYLHPYWYARGSCISFICEEEYSHSGSLFSKFINRKKVRVFNGILENLISFSPVSFEGLMDDSKGLIVGNYAGSGYIDNSKLLQLKNLLNNDEYKDMVNNVFDEDGMKAIKHAINYALKYNTGLIEASDIVVPEGDECFSDYNNLRADYLENDEYYENTREI